MTEYPSRVAVYLDFENLVASRYDEVHGKGSWKSDGQSAGRTPERLSQAKLEIRLILDEAAVGPTAIGQIRS